MGAFSEGVCRASTAAQTAGYVDRKSHWVIAPKYTYADDFHEQLAVVKIDSKFGFIDHTGKIKIPCKFKMAKAFSEGLAPVMLEGKYGFINKQGEFVIEPQYGDADQFSEGLAAVGIWSAAGNLVYGYIDRNGLIIVEPKFKQAHRFSDGLACVSYLDYLWAFIDQEGQVRLSGFRKAGDFGNDLAPVEKNLHLQFINKSNLSAFELPYRMVGMFSEGLAFVEEKSDSNDENHTNAN
jgi:hypothetical protein